MKKLLSLIAILLLLVVLVGCVPDSLLPNTNPGDTSSGQTNTDGTTTSPDQTNPDGTTTNPDDQTTNTPDSSNTDSEKPFENYGLSVIKVDLSKLTIREDGLYTSMQEVGAYLYLYHKLPKNFVTKSVFDKKNVTSANKLSTGGDYFGNREGLLPKGKSYRECDIDYYGGSRNAKRIVYSVTDWTIFYTDDHYESFSILRFVNETHI